MNEMFEYMVPLTGIFKKKRNPKQLLKYQSLDDYEAMVEDFKIAKPFFDDSIRIGKKFIFPKEKITIIYISGVAKATFAIHGVDASDEFSSIDLTYYDGTSDCIARSGDIDRDKVTKDIFPYLNELGIKTTYLENR